MNNSSGPDYLPRDVRQALLRLLQTLRFAPDEIRGLTQLLDQDDGEKGRALKLDRLSHWLYATWYSGFGPPEAAPRSFPGRENLVPALRSSARASTRWETGWVAIRVAPGGACLAGRGNHTRELRPGEYANLSRKGLPTTPGDALAVTELVQWTDQATGFWCARSWCREPRGPLVRVYFSVGGDQVGFVIRAVTGMMDELKLPYSLKCPSLVAAYSRVDSLLVYLEADSWKRAVSAVKVVAKQTISHLRNTTPPLTKRIAHGVAFAEDPGTNQSFGESRCAALAPAALTLLCDARIANSGGLVTLMESLRAAGIDPARPWLNRSRSGQPE